MKKMIALLLSAILVLALSACGSPTQAETAEPADMPSVESAVENSTTADAPDAAASSEITVAESDLIGEWFDLNTSQQLILNADLSGEHFRTRSSSQPLHWSLKGSLLHMNSSTIRNDLTVEMDSGEIRLVNDEFTFMRLGALPKAALELGREYTDDVISITVESVDFSETIPEDITSLTAYSWWLDGEGQKYPLGDSQACVKVVFQLTNLTKNSFTLADNPSMLDAILDYNNGFTFATLTKNACFFYDGAKLVIETGSSRTGVAIEVQPLETKTITLCFPCTDRLLQDTQSPVTLTFLSRIGAAAHYYQLTVR